MIFLYNFQLELYMQTNRIPHEDGGFIAHENLTEEGPHYQQPLRVHYIIRYFHDILSHAHGRSSAAEDLEILFLQHGVVFVYFRIRMLRAAVRKLGFGFKLQNLEALRFGEPGVFYRSVATVSDWSLDHRQDDPELSESRTSFSNSWVCKYATFFDPTIYEVAHRNMRKKAKWKHKAALDERTIHRVIQQMKDRSFQFQPYEIEYIDGKPVGAPSFTEELIQEVLRFILEPVFTKSQPRVSAQGTLQRIRNWTGTTWLITANTPGLLRNLDHSVLGDIIMRAVKDQQLLDLYWKLVNAGLLNTDSKERHNITGVSKGGKLWPLFTNTYLSEFDAHLHDFAKSISTPVLNPPLKIHYIRYGDQWAVGVDGPKSLAVKTRDEISSYLNGNLKLQIDEDNITINHLGSKKVKFLGVLIGTRDKKYVESLVGERAERAFGRIVLEAPVNEIVLKLVDQGFAVNPEFPRGMSGWIHLEAEEILRRYTKIMRGLMQYYSIVDNKNMMRRVFWILRFSGIFTICRKWRISTRALFKKLVNEPQYESFLKGRITSSYW